MTKMFARVVGAIVGLTLAPQAASGAPNADSKAVRWHCSVGLLPDYNDAADEDPNVGEGVTYLYAGDKRLRSNYGADARFSLPLETRRGWYDGAVRLGPIPENNAFVQVEVSRWKRFDYKQHVALAWSVPHGAVQHRDTGLMLADGVAHRLGIDVREETLRVFVDGRPICSAPATSFVTSSERKYFQIRAETSVPGANSAARVADLRLRRDGRGVYRPFASRCILHRHGIAWEPVGSGAFAVRGAFYPTEGTFFTGLNPEKPCRT